MKRLLLVLVSIAGFAVVGLILLSQLAEEQREKEYLLPDEKEPVRRDRSGEPLPPGAVLRLGAVGLRHLDPHGEARSVQAFTYTSDRKVLATCGHGGSFCLFEAETGRLLRQFGHRESGWVRQMAFSRDGKFLALNVNLAWLWDVAAGELKEIRLPGNKQLEWIAFSPDGKYLALAYPGRWVNKAGRILDWGMVSLREVDTLKEVRTFEREGSYPTLIFSPDGEVLIGGGASERSHLVYFWDVATGKELRKIEAPETAFHPLYLALSPDGKLLATGGQRIRLWDTATAKEVQQLGSGGFEFAFSPDSQTLAAARGENQVVLYETQTGKVRATLTSVTARSRPFAFAPDGRTMLFAGEGGSIHRMDLATGKEAGPLGGHLGPVLGLSAASGGKLLASTGADMTVRVWQMEEGKQVDQFPSTDNEGPGTGAVALSPDGKMLAFVNEGIRLRDLTAGREVGQLGEKKWGAKALAFSPDGKKLAGSARQTTLLDVASRKELHRLEGRSGRVAFSPDGSLLATAGGNLWVVATGERAHAPREERADPPLAFSLDGKSLALRAGLFEDEVQLLEVVTGGLRARFETKPSRGSALAFVDGGRVLALAEGNDVVLRDVRADKEILRLKGHRGQVTSLAFDARSGRLFSGSHDSTVLVWDLAALQRAPRRR